MLRLSLRCRRGADDAQVTSAADLDSLANRFGDGRPRRLPGLRRPRLARPGLCLHRLSLDRLCLHRLSLSRLGLHRLGRAGLGYGARLGGALSPAHVTNDIGQCLKVVGALLGRVRRQPDHVPAARHHQAGRVHLAQVPRVGVGVSRKRTEHGRRVLVHVRERVDGRLLARGT